MKKKIINCWVVIVIIAIILWGIFFSYSILKSNIWERIKCPTYPVGYEYEWVIKAEYKSLVLIDWVYRYTNYNELHDWCFWDAWLPEGKFICADWSEYNSWANKEEIWERVLDMEEDACYYTDDDVSMLKAIYDEKHRED